MPAIEPDRPPTRTPGGDGTRIGGGIARLVAPGDMPTMFAGGGVGFALFIWVLMPPLLGLLFQVDYRAID